MHKDVDIYSVYALGLWTYCVTYVAITSHHFLWTKDQVSFASDFFYLSMGLKHCSILYTQLIALLCLERFSV